MREEILKQLFDGGVGAEILAQDLVGSMITKGDNFHFDTDMSQGDLVGETANDWAVPEINYPLTLANVEKFHHRLVTGEDLFTISDAS